MTLNSLFGVGMHFLLFFVYDYLLVLSMTCSLCKIVSKPDDCSTIFPRKSFKFSHTLLRAKLNYSSSITVNV